MVSLLLHAPATAIINNPSSSTSTSTLTTPFTWFPRPLFPNKSQTHGSLIAKREHGSPCRAKKSDDEQGNNKDEGKLDRRNVLIGFGAGGLYGATGLGLGTNPFASALPIPPPDLKTCRPTVEEVPLGLHCCPPLPSTEIIDFKLPDAPPTPRTRLAAHNVDAKYLENYRTAIQRMKDLPEDDPRNFWNQAQVHCAYCDGAYFYIADDGTKKEIQVHSSWLFYPFHRWYLYFYERILAKLIEDIDPNFALPFWNWDGRDGMYLPSIFEEGLSSSPLFNHYRNDKHRQPGFVLDLNYHGTDSKKTKKEIICSNLCYMNRQMLVNPLIGKDLCTFFGQPYRKGDDPNPGAGTIEMLPHNTVHNWTGDRDWNGEDMGVFYSAGRDPIFFAHHANVDRMWYLWKKVLNCKDISDDDWLKTEFLFYDENKKLVRVNVQQSVDSDLLGYNYEQVPIEWLTPIHKPKPRKSLKVAKPNIFTLPVTLDSKVSVKVQRASLKRLANEKAERAEVLVIQGIEFPGDQAVKFDVYVNDDSDTPSEPCDSECAGSFVHVPHKHNHNIKTNMTLGITDLLEDLEAEEDGDVVVTLVPRYGKGPITVGDVKIELSRCFF